MPAVFLTNIMLQQWTDEGKVRLDDTTLTLVAERRTVKLTPAVRFTRLIDGGEDPHKLIGKVKTKEQLVELGAEHYMDSVILGDVGYTVLEGFMGDLSPASRREAAVAPASTTSATTTSAAASGGAPRAPAHFVVAGSPAAEGVVVPATPITEGDDALALSALFLKTVREK